MKYTLTLGVLAIPEIVFLSVGVTEDVVSDAVEGEDGGGENRAKFDGVEGQETSLKGVDEGHPHQITDREHEAKAIARDVHGGEDGRLKKDMNSRSE